MFECEMIVIKDFNKSNGHCKGDNSYDTDSTDACSRLTCCMTLNFLFSQQYGKKSPKT